MKYGLVFRIHEKIFLSEYNESGNIEDGAEIDDPKGVYNSLTENELSFVEVHRYQEDVQYLKDLKTITIKNDDHPEKTVLDLMQEGGGPELARLIYEDIMR